MHGLGTDDLLVAVCILEGREALLELTRARTLIVAFLRGFRMFKQHDRFPPAIAGAPPGYYKVLVFDFVRALTSRHI